MPRFTHPISWQLTNTDENRPGPTRITMRAEIPVEVEDQSGTWRELVVVIDTGASFSMMRTSLATSLGLAIPVTTSTMPLRTATGLVRDVVRDGEIHLRFLPFPERTFLLKCIFRDTLPTDIPPVLGLHNTLDLLTILFDGTRRPDGFMGCMEFITRDQ
ncbi:MAG: retroviral-like aspartic protease family protein [Planctomycetia bacterium]|nr:retroviral-like aspartic protease family protein [Planctomycetia bacterium]